MTWVGCPGCGCQHSPRENLGFENVNIYPLMAKILGLDTTPTDGDLKALAPILRKSKQLEVASFTRISHGP